MLANDREFVTQAVELAISAAREGEYPIGAVLVAADGSVLGSATNQSIAHASRIQHAEIMLLRQIRPRTGIEIPHLTLFTSLEPCLMCFGAAVVSRIKRVVWACNDPFGGAGGLVADWPLPHLPVPETTAEPYPDLRDAACRVLMAFFERTQREDILRVWRDAGVSGK